MSDYLLPPLLAPIADRSDIGPPIALWPRPQIPAFVLKTEQPADTRIIDHDSR